MGRPIKLPDRNDEQLTFRLRPHERVVLYNLKKAAIQRHRKFHDVIVRALQLALEELETQPIPEVTDREFTDPHDLVIPKDGYRPTESE